MVEGFCVLSVFRLGETSSAFSDRSNGVVPVLRLQVRGESTVYLTATVSYRLVHLFPVKNAYILSQNNGHCKVILSVILSGIKNAPHRADHSVLWGA